jgi:hypothetical protein
VSTITGSAIDDFDALMDDLQGADPDDYRRDFGPRPPMDSFWAPGANTSPTAYLVHDPMTGWEAETWFAWSQCFASEGFTAAGIEAPKGYKSVPLLNSDGTHPRTGAPDPLYQLIRPYVGQYDKDKSRPGRPVKTSWGIVVVELYEGRATPRIWDLNSIRYEAIKMIIDAKLDDDVRVAGKAFKFTFEGKKGTQEEIRVSTAKDTPPLEALTDLEFDPAEWSIKAALIARRRFLWDYLQSHMNGDPAGSEAVEAAKAADAEAGVAASESTPSTADAGVDRRELYMSTTPARLRKQLDDARKAGKDVPAIDPKAKHGELVTLAMTYLA